MINMQNEYEKEWVACDLITCQRSLALTTVEWLSLRSMSDQLAVTVAFEEPLFQSTTATLFPLKGPAHTYK